MRGLPITDEQAAEVRDLLRSHAEGSTELADRIDRALIAGMGMLATDHEQARALLAVLPEGRYDEVRRSLDQFVGELPAPL